jgi:hypothetical protein
VAVLAQLRIRHRHQRARDREAETLVAAGVGEDERVDADELTGGVDERSAAVAGVDWRVGLDVDGRRIGVGLPSGRAHHAHRHRVLQALRAAECEHELALPDAGRVRESQRRQIRQLDFQEREIDLARDADDRRVDSSRTALRQHDLHAPCAGHHVSIRDDVAVGVDDDAGSDPPLPAISRCTRPLSPASCAV